MEHLIGFGARLRAVQRLRGLRSRVERPLGIVLPLMDLGDFSATPFVSEPSLWVGVPPRCLFPFGVTTPGGWCWKGCQALPEPTRRLFQPLSGLALPTLRGFISYRLRPWGLRPLKFDPSRIHTPFGAVTPLLFRARRILGKPRIVRPDFPGHADRTRQGRVLSGSPFPVGP